MGRTLPSWQEVQAFEPPRITGNITYCKEDHHYGHSGNPELNEIKDMLVRALEQRAVPEWYTLEQAYRLKFGDPELGPSLWTIKRNRALQPRAGIPDEWMQFRNI